MSLVDRTLPDVAADAFLASFKAFTKSLPPVVYRAVPAASRFVAPSCSRNVGVKSCHIVHVRQQLALGFQQVLKVLASSFVPSRVGV
jgi:hypothetical protein